MQDPLRPPCIWPGTGSLPAPFPLSRPDLTWKGDGESRPAEGGRGQPAGVLGYLSMCALGTESQV